MHPYLLFLRLPVRRVSHSAALKSSLHNTTPLRLCYCHLPSSRHLLRVLADITYLEDIDFIIVTWLGDTITTVDAASNLCNGVFSYVRNNRLRDCTNNMVVPAWILAAASTRHSFTRRRTIGPIVPAETWVIIELMRTFLQESIIAQSQFRVKEATLGNFYSLAFYQIIVFMGYSQDIYTFIGHF